MSEDKYEQVTRSRKEIIINNFIGGISWAIGTIIGATLVVGLITFVLSRLENIDVIGPIVEAVVDKVEEQTNR